MEVVHSPDPLGTIFPRRMFNSCVSTQGAPLRGDPGPHRTHECHSISSELSVVSAVPSMCIPRLSPCTHPYLGGRAGASRLGVFHLRSVHTTTLRSRWKRGVRTHCNCEFQNRHRLLDTERRAPRSPTQGTYRRFLTHAWREHTHTHLMICSYHTRSWKGIGSFTAGWMTRSSIPQARR